MRRSLLLCALAAAMTAAGLARNPVDPVNRGSTGAAVRGYDVVAYFSDGKPVKGSEQFTLEWMGVKWWFATASHKDQFAGDPARYAPQFGGYCAWAVGHNYTADADPEAWKIVDGKLFLNYNRDVQKKWEQDLSKWIAEAQKSWPKLHK